MTTKEATERIKTRFDKWALDDEDLDAIRTLIPELAENEDERIRKELIDFVNHYRHNTDLTTEQVEWTKKAIAYLEKQKEIDTAIAALEKIDKYIDEHTANAHDMKDSNPDKKYYSGVDDTLSDIAGILIEVYSEGKQKSNIEKLREISTPADEDWFEIAKKWEKEDEQKSAIEEILAKAGLKPYKDGNQWCILIGDNIQEGICGFGDTIDEALYQLLKDVLEYHKEQKSEEWREDDKMNLNGCICSLHQYGYITYADFLKHLPERFNLQPKQEWSKDDDALLKEIVSFFKDGTVKLQHDLDLYAVFLEKRLKSLRPQPHWKPSEEQMEALKNCAYGVLRNGDGHVLRELYNDLKKL